MIRARNLHCMLADREVLTAIDLDLASGEILGLLGPNGSGKTSLLLCLAGILPPARGEIRLLGRDISSLSARERARLTASVPQSMSRPPMFTALECVLMGRYAHLSLLGSYSGKDREKALQAMDDVGIRSLAERPVNRLSGGERQKVLLARAMAQESPVLLLDEPTSALDISSSLSFLDLLRKRVAATGAAICAMHDLNLAALYCDRLLFLESGRSVISGPLREIFTEETLSHVYGTRVLVRPHPELDLPQALFTPGAHHPAALAPGQCRGR